MKMSTELHPRTAPPPYESASRVRGGGGGVDGEGGGEGGEGECAVVVGSPGSESKHEPTAVSLTLSHAAPRISLILESSRVDFRTVNILPS